MRPCWKLRENWYYKIEKMMIIKRCPLPPLAGQAQLSQYHSRTSRSPTRIYLVGAPSLPCQSACLTTEGLPFLICVGRGPVFAFSISVFRVLVRFPREQVIDNIERLVEYGGEEVLECLAVIVAASPTIHLVASVDHHRSALMGNILETFAFLNIPVHTRLDYTRELMAFNGRALPAWTGLGGGRGEGCTAYGGAGLAVVLKSLTPNHLNLLKHLALLLLDTSEPDGTVPFDTLLKVTKRKAIASNHVKLKSLLTELIDHRVVIQRRAPTTGAQTYHMPYGKKQIEVISQGDFDSVDKV
ncbi:Origin recognition complex subunit 2 [Perkinsus olseni]|uniref:Origin recognition complex subunit 2 n=1 Tax=Perkinsus olseni TaxID=32597 RepID=A0A7J6UJ73_PEROL|nr:Origin recognition complex subunit 2 [Perkinsus olseni]